MNETKHKLFAKEFDGHYNIKQPEVYGFLVHEPTEYSFTCYKPVSRFKAFMLKWCFGLRYEKLKWGER